MLLSGLYRIAAGTSRGRCKVLRECRNSVWRFFGWVFFGRAELGGVGDGRVHPPAALVEGGFFRETAPHPSTKRRAVTWTEPGRGLTRAAPRFHAHPTPSITVCQPSLHIIRPSRDRAEHGNARRCSPAHAPSTPAASVHPTPLPTLRNPARINDIATGYYHGTTNPSRPLNGDNGTPSPYVGAGRVCIGDYGTVVLYPLLLSLYIISRECPLSHHVPIRRQQSIT